MPLPSHVNIDPKLPNVAGPSSSERTGNSAASSPVSPTRETPNFSRPLHPNPSIVRSAAPSPGGAQAARSTSASPRPLPSVPGHSYSHSRHSIDHAHGGRGSGLGTRIIDDRDPDDLVPPYLTQRHGQGQDEDEKTSTAASDSELLYASAPSTPPHAHTELGAEEDEEGDTTVRISGNGDGRGLPPERRATVAMGEDAGHGRGGTVKGFVSPRRAATTDYDLRGNQGRKLPDPLAPQTHGQARRNQGGDHLADDLEYEDDVDSYLRKLAEQSGGEPTFPEPHVQGRATHGPPSFPEPQVHHPRSLPQPILFGLPVPEHRTPTGSEVGHRTDSRPAPLIPPVISFPNPSTERQDTSWKSPPSSTHGAQSSHQAGSSAGHFIAGTNLQFEPLSYPHDINTQPQPHAGSSAHTQPPRPLPPSPSQGRNDSVASVASAPSTVHDPKRKSDQESSSGPPGHATTAASSSAGPSGTAPLRVSKHTPSSNVSSGIFVSAPGRDGQASRPPLPPVPVTGSEKAPSAPAAPVVPSTEAAAPKPQSRPQPKIPATPESTSKPQSGTPLPSSATPSSSQKAPRPAPKENVGGSSRVQAPQTGKRDAVGAPTAPPKPGGTPDGEKIGTSPELAANRAKESRPSSAPHPQSQSHYSEPVSNHSPPARPPPAEAQQPRTLAEEKAKYNAIPPSSRSRYMNMLLALDDIPAISNLSASFFTWILLAGFVLFPGTFTSIQNLNLGGGVGAELVNSIVNLPLFVVAFICTGIGIIGMGYLWWRWMKNYIWLVNKIFLPGLLNSLAGIISTLVNVYGVQNGEFNKTSIITIAVTGGVGVVCGVLVLWYGVWLLGRVKRRHNREIGVLKAGNHGEGAWGGFKEKVSKAGRRK